MLPLLAFGILLVILVHFSLREFSRTNPAGVKKASRWLLYFLVFVLVIWLIRLGMVHYAAVAAFFGFLFMVAQRASTAARLWNHLRDGKKEPAEKTPSPKMTKAEARKILGVSAKASHQEIQEAYRRVIRQTHPDQGGTEYLASQVNLARDTLLE